MSTTNPEIEAQLNAFSKLCCESLKRTEPLAEKRVKELAKALLMSGFEHRKNAPLSAVLERRVREMCPEPAIHRGAEIKSFAGSIQKTHDD